ncbi:MAG: LysR family transcriptional regulator, partial [Hyphomicrobiales bacterium]|nr:LysR family transcriptional regulator [Hyphomicrobiales bacterium]
MTDFRGVTLKQLRALVATTRSGTVTAAAQMLNVTPPAVTSQIKLLEESVGLPLLDRTESGFKPTDAGRFVLAAVARIEDALTDCAEALEGVAGLDAGRVAVGVVSTAKYFAPMVLGAFGKAHPAIDIRLVVGNRRDILEALSDFAIDIAVMGRPPEGIDVERAVIGDHPHIVIAPPDHRLAGRRDLSFADLAEETFLVREVGSGTRILMERRLADAGIAPRVGMEIGSNETIKQAVIAGLGIAFISGHTIE